MGLIYCQDCGTQISDKATACPKCGCPLTLPPFKVIEENDGEETPQDVSSNPSEGESPTPTSASQQVAERKGGLLRRRSRLGLRRGRKATVQQVVRTQNIYTRNLRMQSVPYGPYGQPQKTNGMAIAGFVLGLCSVVLILTFYVPLVCGPLAIIFSLIGLGQSNGRGLAFAGLVLGLIAVALLALAVLGIMALFSSIRAR